ncbi:hypothetical protein Neosp_012238 [[Neocosmospora] mangrovei]
MASPSHAQKVADAALLTRFREELQKFPPSQLGKDLLAAYDMPSGTPRDEKIIEVLKKHNFDSISVDGLETLLNRRPVDTSEIQPPESLGDEKDPTKPEVSFEQFAGTYRVKSTYSPPGFKVTVQANNADKTKGVITWGSETTHREFSAKFQSSIQKGEMIYWAVWGDKNSEWWSVQFFGPSTTTVHASFVGFRHTKEKPESPDRFEGEMIVPKTDPVHIWFGISLLVGLSVLGAYKYYNRRAAQQLAQELPALQGGGQAAGAGAGAAQVEEVAQEPAPEAEPAQQELERKEMEKRKEILKEAGTRGAATEFLTSWAQPHHKELVELLEVGVGNILTTEYQPNEKQQESDYGKPLSEKLQGDIDKMKSKTITDYIERGSLHAAKLAELYTTLFGVEISPAKIKELAVERFSKANQYNSVSKTYAGLMGGIVDKMRELADAKITEQKILETNAAISVKVKAGQDLLDANKFHHLVDIMYKHREAEAKSAHEINKQEREKYEHEAKEHKERFEVEMKKIETEAHFEVEKQQKFEKDVRELDRLVKEKASHEVRKNWVNDPVKHEKKMAEMVKKICKKA